MLMMMAQGGEKGYQGDEADANDQFFSMYQSKYQD